MQKLPVGKSDASAMAVCVRSGIRTNQHTHKSAWSYKTGKWGACRNNRSAAPSFVRTNRRANEAARSSLLCGCHAAAPGESEVFSPPDLPSDSSSELEFQFRYRRRRRRTGACLCRGEALRNRRNRDRGLASEEADDDEQITRAGEVALNIYESRQSVHCGM